MPSRSCERCRLQPDGSEQPGLDRRSNGDGTRNDLQISAAVAMTNGVTIGASGLTGANHIVVVGTNLGGADTITGGAGVDTIDGGAGKRYDHGRCRCRRFDRGLGADTFVIGTVAHLAAGETINGTAEAGTIDTLRLDAAGTYNLSTFSTITNIDAIAFNVNAAGFNLTVVNSQVSTADANGDGTQNDLQISASVAITNGVTIGASGLTGAITSSLSAQIWAALTQSPAAQASTPSMAGPGTIRSRVAPVPTF